MSAAARNPANGMANDNRARSAREKFAEIDRRRRADDVSVEALCGACGVSFSTWYRIVRGESEPRSSTLRKLRRGLERLLAETIDPRR